MLGAGSLGLGVRVGTAAVAVPVSRIDLVPQTVIAQQARTVVDAVQRQVTTLETQTVTEEVRETVIDTITEVVTEQIDRIVLQDVETVVNKKVPRKVVEEVEQVVYDTVRKVVIEKVPRTVQVEVTEIEIQEIEKVIYDEVIENIVEVIEETVIDEIVSTETRTVAVEETVQRTGTRQVPTTDTVTVTKTGTRDEDFTFSVPVTKTGTRQVTQNYFDIEQRERQVARAVRYSDDSGDGIDSGAESRYLSLNSAGDSDIENDFADNIAYIKAGKFGADSATAAAFGFSGQHGEHWKGNPSEITSEDDVTLDAGDATSDDLYISADSSDDVHIVYDTVIDNIRVPRQRTVDVPYTYIE